MIRLFLRNSALYAVSGLLTRGLSFLLLPLYTRAFSVAEYGVFDYLTVLGAFVAVTAALEISQGIARYIPECRADDQARREYASTAFWFSVGSYTLMVLLVAQFRHSVSQWAFGTSEHADLLLIAAASYLVSGLVYLIQCELRAELRARASSLLALLAAALSIGLSVVLVVWLRWGVAGALLGQIGGGLITLVCGLHVARSSYGLRFERARLRAMLAFSLPLVPSSVSVMVLAYIDRVAIMQLMTATDVGLYGVSYRVAMIASLFMLGFTHALTPLIYSHYTEPDTPRQIAKLFRVFAFLTLLAFTGLSLFADQVVALIAAPDYAAAAGVIPLQALAALFSSMYIFAPGLDIEKRTAVIAAIHIGAATLNTVLVYLLVPRLGINGAGLATCVSMLTAFGVKMAFSQRLYFVPHRWDKLLGGFAVTAGAVWAMTLVGISGLALIALRVAVYGAVFLLLLLFRLLEPEEMQRLLRVVQRARRRVRPGS